MVGMIVKVLIGVVLFAGSLVGGLAATGRLNHAGTTNIPLLNLLFPAPPVEPEGEGDDAAKAKDEHGQPIDAPAAPGGETKPTDAAHDGQQDPQQRRKKVGKSVDAKANPEPASGGEHGTPAEDKGAHDKGKGEDSEKPHGTADSSAKRSETAAAKNNSPESDFQHLQGALASSKSHYTPGELFRFEGLPAGVTPEQINEAWQRVQGLLTDLERRKVALDLREQELQELHEETGRRQAALGKERVEIEQMQRLLDQKIKRFEEQVKLVRNDEVAALKRNAQTLAAFEPEKAAQLIDAQWKTERGQDEVLKLLEFMDKDAVNEILKVLPPPMASDVMKKRMRVSREAVPPGKGN
jgi:hypothetical protein